MILSNFTHIKPRYLLDQAGTLRWLALAHARAEAMKPGNHKKNPPEDLSRLFQRYGCSSDQVATRGVEIKDFTHTSWEKMDLFRFENQPQGPGMIARTAFFQKAGMRVCKALYPPDSTPPQHLIHVTCTGYVSPSCAQELVARNRWQDRTVVTHAYHMGCYAALPALRIARGFLSGDSGEPSRKNPCNGRVDMLHTEVCSIHLQTGNLSPEQIVVQSLFADGFIRYSAAWAKKGKAKSSPGLRIEGLHEELIPRTLQAITWNCGEWGMIMGLSRDVPQLIADSLSPFLEELCRRSRVSLKKVLAKSIFAVHPGGPKIIDRIQTLFHLSDEQLSTSRAVLKSRGNMSSATLPHIWESLLADAAVAEGRLVVSLAFGPGLCISGALMRKVA